MLKIHTSYFLSPRFRKIWPHGACIPSWPSHLLEDIACAVLLPEVIHLPAQVVGLMDLVELPLHSVAKHVLRDECPLHGDLAFPSPHSALEGCFSSPLGQIPWKSHKQLITHLPSAPPGRPQPQSTKGIATMPGKCPAERACLLTQPMATPLKADKTLSTISPFILALRAKGIKHSCQTQINV